MLKVEYFSEDSMEDLTKSLEEFFDDESVDEDDLKSIQCDFRHHQALVVYYQDDDDD